MSVKIEIVSHMLMLYITNFHDYLYAIFMHSYNYFYIHFNFSAYY